MWTLVNIFEPNEVRKLCPIWRHARLGLIVLLTFCLIFFLKEYQFITENSQNSDERYAQVKGAMRHQFNYNENPIESNDDILMLKAHVGYLKKKLATLGQTDTFKDPSLPTIYVITPTHTRPEQKAELVRVSQVFLLVPNLHWIVIEDSKEKTPLVSNLLSNSGLTFTHLNVETPPESKLTEKDPHWSKPRGVDQRNAALSWLRENFRDGSGNEPNGVIYFADDDNTYHVQIFEEMRFTKGVSVWPVGLVGGLMLEKPKVELTPESQGKKVVTGWDVSWAPERPFAIDMAGFAVNLKLFLSKLNSKFAFKVKRGHQESEFLGYFVTDLKDLEIKSDDCSKVWVWHTRTEKVNLKSEKARESLHVPPSNKGIEV